MLPTQSAATGTGFVGTIPLVLKTSYANARGRYWSASAVKNGRKCPQITGLNVPRTPTQMSAVTAAGPPHRAHDPACPPLELSLCFLLVLHFVPETLAGLFQAVLGQLLILAQVDVV